MTDNPTFVEYTGAGAQTDFVFPFSYLSVDHIKVTVAGVARAFALPAQNTVRISPAPTGLVRIARVTPGTALVTWNDGAVILGKDLNLSTKQPVNVAEEARDIAAEAKDVASTNVDAALEAVGLAAAQVDLAEAQVGLAAAQVTVALGHANAAAVSASQAAATKTLVDGIYDAFDDRYLGMKASDPATDNDGNALQIGAIYFNTAAQELRILTANGWTAAYIPNNGSVVSFNGRTGAVNPATNDYAVAQINGLQTALDGKAATSHTHTIANITSLQTTLDGKAAAAAYARLDVETQALTGGAAVAVKDLGTIATGTLALNLGARPIQKVTNNGAFTLDTTADRGTGVLYVLNGTTPGAISFTGGITSGDTLTTTVGHKFLLFIYNIEAGVKLCQIKALQ